MDLFGQELQISPIALAVISVIVVFAIVGVVALFLRWRKRIWYALVSAVLSILIAIFIPLILDQLLWIQIMPDSDLLMKIIYACESSFFVLILKRILGWGFSISNKSLREQS